MLNLYDLKTEYRVNPIGLDEPQPAFSWKLNSDKSGVTQRFCRIIVQEGETCVWDSGRLETEQSLYHAYAGSALKPRTCYQVTVEVTDNHGESAAAGGDL